MRAVRLLLASAFSILAIVALSAATASAAAIESEWMIEGETLSELEASEESISLSGGPISIIVPGKWTVECKKASNSDAIFKGGTDKLVISLTECSVLTLPACKVSEPVALEAKATLIQVGESRYYKVEPLSAEKPFGTLTIKGAECTLPEKSEVKGSVAAEPSLEAQVKQPLTFSEAISKAANEGLKAESEAELELKVGSLSAKLSGELTMALSGANSGLQWGDYPFTRLCTAQVPMCTGGQIIPKATTIKGETEAATKFKYEKNGSPVSAKCSSVKFEGITGTSGGAPLVGTFTTAALTCEGGCTAVVEAGIMPLVFRIWATQNGDGRIGMWGTGSPLVEFKIVCNAITCVYASSGLLYKVKGGMPAKFSRPIVTQLTLRVGISEGCSDTGTWEGSTAAETKFKFTAPGTMYVTG